MTIGSGRAALLGGAVFLSALGCDKTMNEGDCSAVAANMRKVWDEEAKKAAAPDAPGAEKAAAVIQAEGQRMVDGWMAECKQELEGRRVDKKEIECLLAATTVDGMGKCAD